MSVATKKTTTKLDPEDLILSAPRIQYLQLGLPLFSLLLCMAINCLSCRIATSSSDLRWGHIVVQPEAHGI